MRVVRTLSTGWLVVSLCSAFAIVAGAQDKMAPTKSEDPARIDEAWQKASIGYVQQTLKAYRTNPVWTVDPKHTPFRDIPERTVDDGYAGALGTASAGVMADYVMVNMVAEAASGASSPADAAAKAERRAKRYYRT